MPVKFQETFLADALIIGIACLILWSIIVYLLQAPTAIYRYANAPKKQFMETAIFLIFTNALINPRRLLTET